MDKNCLAHASGRHAEATLNWGGIEILCTHTARTRSRALGGMRANLYFRQVHTLNQRLYDE